MSSFSFIRLLLEGDDITGQSGENVITPWDAEATHIETGAKFIQKNCGDALRLLARNFLLYRGDRTIDKVAIVDSSKSKRRSRDTSNLYQLAIEAARKDVPARSNSIICATSVMGAEIYGRPHAVFPVDGTKAAYVKSPDMFMSRVNSELFTGSVVRLDGTLLNFFIAAGLPKSTPTDISELDSLLESYDPLFLALLWIANRGRFSLFVGGLSSTDEDLKMKLNASIGLLHVYPLKDKRTMDAIKEIVQMIKAGDVKIRAPELIEARKVFSEAPKNAKFTALAKALVNEDALKIPLVDLSRGKNLPEKNLECWFSGKCVMVDLKMIDRLFAIFEERGYIVAPELKEELSRYKQDGK